MSLMIFGMIALIRHSRYKIRNRVLIQFNYCQLSIISIAVKFVLCSKGFDPISNQLLGWMDGWMAELMDGQWDGQWDGRPDGRNKVRSD